MEDNDWYLFNLCIWVCLRCYCFFSLLLKKQLYGPFLCMGLNCLKVTELLREDSLLFTTIQLLIHFFSTAFSLFWKFLPTVTRAITIIYKVYFHFSCCRPTSLNMLFLACLFSSVLPLQFCKLFHFVDQILSILHVWRYGYPTER